MAKPAPSWSLLAGSRHDLQLRSVGWQRVLIRNVRYSFSGSAPRLSAWLEDRSQIRGECSERLAWAHSSSGHALLAGIRLAASMRAARAGSPRSSKSSRAARCSNRVAPCGPGELEGGIDVGSARVWVGARRPVRVARWRSTAARGRDQSARAVCAADQIASSGHSVRLDG
jgi:hypothetical protein